MSGYTGDETEDCLAMEELPIGIGYYPMDCTAKLHVICHKFPGIDVSLRLNYFLKKETDLNDRSRHKKPISVYWKKNGQNFKQKLCNIWNDIFLPLRCRINIAASL